MLSVPGSGVDGIEVAPEALASASALGSGTRVISIWAQRWAQPTGPVCVYLHAVGDPGNVGAIVRTTQALVAGSVVLGPDCADPYSPKAVRASMGSIFALPIARAGVARDADAADRDARPRRRAPGARPGRADPLPRR